MDHMVNDFRSGITISKYIQYELIKRKTYTLKYLFFRLIMLLPAKIISLFKSKIDKSGLMESADKFAEYRDQNTLTYSKIMLKSIM